MKNAEIALREIQATNERGPWKPTWESLGPPERLIHIFIDIVSNNGNLAIIGGPDESGIYPENVVLRLKALGNYAWSIRIFQ